MKDYLYIVNDLVFESEEGKHNAKSRAYRYCKKNNIDLDTVKRVRNDIELKYYRLLVERMKNNEVTEIDTEVYFTVIKGFHNAKDEYLPPVMDIVPFFYVDSEGKKHYVYIATCLKDLDVRMVVNKYLFDKENILNKTYLQLLYLDDNEQFKEFLTTDIEIVRKRFREKKHEQQLAKLRGVRMLEKYERLLKLRAEGKITDNQRKELYRLEEIYERG